MRLIIVIFLLLKSCDFAEDPTTKIFRISKELTVVNEKLSIDPSISNLNHFIYDMLFQNLNDISNIYTDDSIVWKVQLKDINFSLASNDRVQTEDIYYSFQKNLNRLNTQSENHFNNSFKRFEKISELEMIFEFNKKFEFKKLATTSSFYIFSKHNSSLDIPIGTGKHMIFLRPENQEYVLMPFTKFIHTQNDSIDKIYWINTTKEKLLKRNYKFLQMNEKRINELRNYAIR